jgi:hypothetical protein
MLCFDQIPQQIARKSVRCVSMKLVVESDEGLRSGFAREKKGWERIWLLSKKLWEK